MPDLSVLTAFYSPETGFNWNLIITWVLVLGVAKGFFPKVFDRLSQILLKILNKIPMLEGTDLDEKFFEVMHQYLSTKVLAKMPDAKAIKNRYHLELRAALHAQDGAKVELLTRKMREELEKLTEEIKRDFFLDGESMLWKKLIERYGDKAKAAKWVYEKIKSLVETLKSPDHPSTSALIREFLVDGFTELGNARSNGEE